MKRLSYLLILVYFLDFYSFSQKKLEITSGIPSYTYLNRNLISTGFINNGISDIDEMASGPGLSYPKLSGKTSMFVSGFLWGTLITGDTLPHVGGSAYRSGLQPGRILNSGLPWNQLIFEDPNSPNVRIFRVRIDIYPGGPPVDLSDEAILESKTEEEIRAQYETDWLEWPVSSGAPFEDINLNGTYEAELDIPGYIGADQTIWFVANDLNPALTQNLYGSNPLGIEVQVTIWAYNQMEFLNHVFFKNYTIINKSNTTFNNTYLSFWADPDIGTSLDDFAGCDTLLNMSYAYNGDSFDDIYGFTPPAIGLMLLKGPKVNSSTNLEMNASYYFSRGDVAVTDPLQGDPQGSVQFYNFMQGKVGLTGQLFIDPTTGQNTTFALWGDPITQTGWVDGMLIPAGDRRIGLATGPFSMFPGDTQKVYFSEILGVGNDRIESIKVLRYNSILSKEIFDSNFAFTRVPSIPSPVLTIEQVDSTLVLKWDVDSLLTNTIENFSQEGFSFQGYSIYQLSENLEIQNVTKRIALYDIDDGITSISGTVMGPNGYPVNGVLYQGNDSGIMRQFVCTSDLIENTYFIPGKKYYFAVTAYGYNPNTGVNPNTIESLIKVVEISFTDTTSWINYGQILEVMQIAGTGEADILPTVVDPYALTSHLYKVYFSEDFIGNLQWNLRDMALGTDVLIDQQNFSGSPTSPITDGLQLKITGSKKFVSMSKVLLNGIPLGRLRNGSTWGNNTWDITDFTYFGFENGFANTSLPNYGGAGGTTNVGVLKQDYEIRWTGVLGDTTINGINLTVTKFGGSLATLFGASNYSLSNHPLNPSPGSDQAFIVRVPFEVWNKDINEQVNVVYWDRSGDPTVSGGEIWNRSNRTYMWIINTPYTAEFINVASQIVLDNATWNLVWYKSDFIFNDVVTVLYNAPIQASVDEFTFQNTIVDANDYNTPLEFYLSQNYPNPFNPKTKIDFSVTTRGWAVLNLYNIIGQKVSTLFNDVVEPGKHSVIVDGSHLASGVYIYVLKVEDKIYESRKMVLLK